MNFIKGVIQSVFTQVLSAFILAVIGIGTTSAINTGSFFNYLSKISIHTWIVIFVFSIVIVFILKLISVNRENSVYYPLLNVITDEREVARISYDGVIWRVMYPCTAGYRKEKISPSYVTVNSNPFCPKCQTELIEKKAIIGRFRWKCPNCKFSKTKIKNRHMVALEAEKVARMRIEKELK